MESKKHTIIFVVSLVMGIGVGAFLVTAFGQMAPSFQTECARLQYSLNDSVSFSPLCSQFYQRGPEAVDLFYSDCRRTRSADTCVDVILKDFSVVEAYYRGCRTAGGTGSCGDAFSGVKPGLHGAPSGAQARRPTSPRPTVVNFYNECLDIYDGSVCEKYATLTRNWVHREYPLCRRTGSVQHCVQQIIDRSR